MPQAGPLRSPRLSSTPKQAESSSGGIDGVGPASTKAGCVDHRKGLRTSESGDLGFSSGQLCDFGGTVFSVLQLPHP